MRIARDLGTVKSLLPEGISLRDAPYPLHAAIKRALTFLSFEELREEDLPPRNIWMDNESLNQHFKRLKAKHRDASSGNEIEDPVDNAALDMLIVGGR